MELMRHAASVRPAPQGDSNHEAFTSAALRSYTAPNEPGDMSSASADASAALAHPALLIHADEKDGLVIRPVDGDANAARLRWGSSEPEEIATQASSPQRGLQVHCLGGILSGFQGTSCARSARLSHTMLTSLPRRLFPPRSGRVWSRRHAAGTEIERPRRSQLGKDRHRHPAQFLRTRPGGSRQANRAVGREEEAGRCCWRAVRDPEPEVRAGV